MAKPLVIDAGPLGKIAHPNAKPDTAAKYRILVNSGRTLVIPEVADYEVRRELLVAGLSQSILRLDELNEEAFYLAITTQHMRVAAQLWAKCKKAHRPNADPKRLDGDVIIAAQALAVGGEVVTENPSDFQLLVDTIEWKLIDSSFVG